MYITVPGWIDFVNPSSQLFLVSCFLEMGLSSKIFIRFRRTKTGEQSLQGWIELIPTASLYNYEPLVENIEIKIVYMLVSRYLVGIW